jgi:hypothetical protein
MFATAAVEPALIEVGAEQKVPVAEYLGGQWSADVDAINACSGVRTTFDLPPSVS